MYLDLPSSSSTIRSAGNFSQLKCWSSFPHHYSLKFTLSTVSHYTAHPVHPPTKQPLCSTRKLLAHILKSSVQGPKVTPLQVPLFQRHSYLNRIRRRTSMNQNIHQGFSLFRFSLEIGRSYINFIPAVELDFPDCQRELQCIPFQSQVYMHNYGHAFYIHMGI
ncbi:hypothetical protein XENOCAPTIV_018241 [Xenoophorus captivus]|uniref:Uncharacterized protein n=1 Tax=Xenoophorus captivus TaxID=1517983 RepID=A0ABV0RSV9_9TELE